MSTWPNLQTARASAPPLFFPAHSLFHRPRYQLRLYCTSSQYYIPTGTAFRAAVCPIEFPPTCEVRINSQPLGTNFRGIKKKPGTAPPADVTALTKRGTAGTFNQVEMVYVNSAQAVAGKVNRYELDGDSANFGSETPTTTELLPGC